MLSVLSQPFVVFWSSIIFFNQKDARIYDVYMIYDVIYENKLSVQNTKIHDRKCLLILRSPIAPAEGTSETLGRSKVEQ